MALQSSGAISLQDIANEFGGSTPHSISEYYRGGSFVPSSVTQVPASGTIDFADFYGTQAAIIQTLSSNASNQNVSTIFGSNFTANVAKILIINSGVEIGATNTNNSALNVPSGMGGTLTIQNAGTISGAGGAGSSSSSQAGGNGETALYIGSNSVTVTNTGTIRGGGGGGGRGANGSNGHSGTIAGVYCDGGSGGSGGSGGNGQGYNQSQSNGSGGTGSSLGTCTYPSGGSQGSGGTCDYLCGLIGGTWGAGRTDGSSGGNGGTYGNAGSQGNGGGSAGGSAGKYIKLGSGISYSLSNSGTLQGNAP